MEIGELFGYLAVEISELCANRRPGFLIGAWVSDRQLGFADWWLGVANQRVEIGESAWWV